MASIEHEIVREVTKVRRHQTVQNEENNDEVDFRHDHSLANLLEILLKLPPEFRFVRITLIWMSLVTGQRGVKTLSTCIHFIIILRGYILL